LLLSEENNRCVQTCCNAFQKQQPFFRKKENMSWFKRFKKKSIFIYAVETFDAFLVILHLLETNISRIYYRPLTLIRNRGFNVETSFCTVVASGLVLWGNLLIN